MLDSARKEFIANASHELRTPIFSLGGFVELLEDEDPDPEAREEFVAEMRGQVERLTKLTVDLLDLSKLDADAIEIRARARRPRRRRPRGWRPSSGRRPTATASTIAIDGAPGAAARADPDRVAQIIRILIDNALTHTPEGTAIKVGTRRQRDERLGQLMVDRRRPGHRRRAPASASSTASTPATRSAAPASGSRSRASSRRAWAAPSSCARRRGRTEFELRLPAAPRCGHERGAPR